MKKGSRVRIKTGPQTGVMGSIFWTGKDKYRGGMRFGIRGDDGETHWVSESDVEPTDAPEPEIEQGETFDKGDRVEFKNRGNTGTGTVFWTGDSRQGGQRLGVRDDADPDNAVWIDARFCTRTSVPAPEGGGGGRRSRDSGSRGADSGGGDWGADEHFVDNSLEAAQAGMDVRVPEPPAELGGPPIDDGYYDSLASSIDDDDDSPPW